MCNIVVLGDFGGQLALFKDVLSTLGVHEPDYRLPPNLVIIQVGDVARASTEAFLDSDGCIALADKVLRQNPQQYIQLMGNHEAAMIGNFYSHRPGVRFSRTVQRWWDERLVRLAVGVRATDGSELLVSHAGLTVGQWKMLGEPGLQEAVERLNSRVSKPIEAVSVPGSLTSGAVNTAADTMWAEVDQEFYEPWTAHGRPPFSFVHGHASPYSWKKGEWWPNASPDIRKRTVIDYAGRVTRTDLSTPREWSRWAQCVDWGVEDRNPVAGTIWRVEGALVG